MKKSISKQHAQASGRGIAAANCAMNAGARILPMGQLFRRMGFLVFGTEFRQG